MISKALQRWTLRSAPCFAWGACLGFLTARATSWPSLQPVQAGTCRVAPSARRTVNRAERALAAAVRDDSSRAATGESLLRKVDSLRPSSGIARQTVRGAAEATAAAG